MLPLYQGAGTGGHGLMELSECYECAQWSGERRTGLAMARYSADSKWPSAVKEYETPVRAGSSKRSLMGL